MEERGKMKIKGMCAEDIVNSLVRNGYDVITNHFAKDNCNKPMDERITIIEYSKAENLDELPF